MSSELSNSRLELSGDLTISCISSTFEKISAAMVGNGPLEISIDGDAEVDLSFVQLIESARNTAERNGVTFTLASPATGQLHDTLTRGGFLNSDGGASAPFWQAEL